MKIYRNIEKESESTTSLKDIENALYQIADGIDVKEYYKIHVNFVNNSYIITFDPNSKEVPIIKLTTYISKSDNEQRLRITPKGLNVPSDFIFNNYNNYLDIVNMYETVFDIISALYDFEFKL